MALTNCRMPRMELFLRSESLGFCVDIFAGLWERCQWHHSEDTQDCRFRRLKKLWTSSAGALWHYLPPAPLISLCSSQICVCYHALKSVSLLSVKWLVTVLFLRISLRGDEVSFLLGSWQLFPPPPRRRLSTLLAHFGVSLCCL